MQASEKGYSINQVKFAPLSENILAAAQDDSLLTLYDVNTQQRLFAFTNHKSNVKGISFSPLNKLLLSSVSLDKHIMFYDIQQKKRVSTINTGIALQSISFNYDGHTVAVGA